MKLRFRRHVLVLCALLAPLALAAVGCDAQSNSLLQCGAQYDGLQEAACKDGVQLAQSYVNAHGGVVPSGMEIEKARRDCSAQCEQHGYGSRAETKACIDGIDRYAQQVENEYGIIVGGALGSSSSDKSE